MSDGEHAVDELGRVRAVVVVRAPAIADPAALAACLVAAGLPVVEIALTCPGALEAIEACRSVEGALVGAGTVRSAEDARRCADAGAQFLVTPHLAPAAAATACELRLPVIVGALTPTEVAAALEEGAAAVKIFPARLGGPAYIADLRGPLPGVAFVASGGVDEHNAGAFLAAGAFAVTAGTSVVAPADVAAARHGDIALRAAAFRRACDTTS